MSLPVIEVPAPWGLGVVLDLVPKLVRPCGVAAGVYQVVQVESCGDVRGVCEELSKRAISRHGKGPADLAPLGAGAFRGPLGSVKVVGCQSIPKGGCYLLLTDPKPDWSHIYEPRAARCFKPQEAA